MCKVGRGHTSHCLPIQLAMSTACTTSVSNWLASVEASFPMGGQTQAAMLGWLDRTLRSNDDNVQKHGDERSGRQKWNVRSKRLRSGGQGAHHREKSRQTRSTGRSSVINSGPMHWPLRLTEILILACPHDTQHTIQQERAAPLKPNILYL